MDPILCYRDKSKSIYRHWSLANDVFKRSASLVFDCGKCVFCRKLRSRELAMRCVLESSLYDENCFLTLTYDESLSDYENILDYKHIQDFKKALRSRIFRSFDKRVNIFNVHEYGKNGKKHWHLVIFNYDFPDKKVKFVRDGYNLYTSDELSSLWTFGIHSIGDVTLASAMYQAQYTQKEFQYSHGRRAHSKHSGIGRDWFLRNYDQVLRLGYIPFEGRRERVPRYFEKIAHKHWSHFYSPSNFFDTDQRKKLYSPFKKGEESKAIADLFINYKKLKQVFIDERILEWNDFVSEHWLDDKVDFQQSGENFLYDLNNRPKGKEF